MLALMLFSCGDGKLTPPDPADPQAGGQSHLWARDGMPFVTRLERQGYAGSDPQRDAIARYESAAVTLSLLPTATSALTAGAGSVLFDDYSFHLASPAPEPVYTFTSGYLRFLPAGQATPDLIAGCVADVDLLILTPFPSMITRWKNSQPNCERLLTECVYLNVQLLPDPELEDLISSSQTEEYFGKLYAEKTGSTYTGSGPWESEYLRLFKTYPDVPIVIRGERQFATSLPQSASDPSQRLTLRFGLEGVWSAHAVGVRTFFQYHQRRDGLGGHPMIAALLGQPVRTGTVDLISPFQANGMRDRARLFLDWDNHSPAQPWAYHPLALDPDEHPHRLVVARPPSIGPLPSTLVLPSDHGITRFKISNPLALPIAIEGADPSVVTLVDVSASLTELIFEVSATPDSPNELRLRITADGILAQELVLTFLPFQTFPVKFHKLTDNDPSHQTVMTDVKLRTVIDHANEILGRQTNVYLYPVETEGTILPILHFDGVLGDPIYENWGPGGSDELYDQVAAMSVKNDLRVIWVWDFKGQEAIGANHRPEGYPPEYMLVLLDTSPFVLPKSTEKAMAQTLVHEIGHWFSTVFIRWNPSDASGPPDCAGADKHFDHKLCVGDWSFNSNLMTPVGSDGVFITFEQAVVFNVYAAGVNP